MISPNIKVTDKFYLVQNQLNATLHQSSLTPLTHSAISLIALCNWCFCMSVLSSIRPYLLPLFPASHQQECPHPYKLLFPLKESLVLPHQPGPALLPVKGEFSLATVACWDSDPEFLESALRKRWCWQTQSNHRALKKRNKFQKVQWSRPLVPVQSPT